MPILCLLHYLLPSVFIFLSLSNAYAAAALTFNVTTPLSCNPFTVDWTGGTPPFKLIVITPGQASLTFSIPDANFQAGTGLFTLPQLKVAVNKTAMFGIADASGFATKLSPPWRVQASTNGSQCDTTLPAPPFSFSLRDEVRECQVVTFGLVDSGATLPVTVYSFLPEFPRSRVLVQGITNGTTLDWQNDFPGGTQVAFSIVDAQGRLGATSDIKTIIAAADKSCLTNSTSTTTGTLPTTPTSTPNPTQTPSKALPIAAIAGGAAGGAVFLTAVALLLFFLLRNRKKTHPTLLLRKPELAYGLVVSNSRDGPVENIVTPFRVPSRPEPLPFNLKARLDQLDVPTLSGPQSALITPSADSGASGYQNHQHENPFSVSSNSSQSSAHSQSQRVIVHRDITERGREGQMLELPPQYSAVRAPIPGLPSGEPSPSTPSPTRPGRRKGRT